MKLKALIIDDSLVMRKMVIGSLLRSGLAKFDFVEQGSDAKLVFDHTGFPKGEAEHLVEGWKTNYWQPLSKFLALP